MKINESYFENASAEPKNTIKNYTSDSFVDYVNGLYTKELEVNKISSTSLEFQTQIKHSSESYLFKIEGTQFEIESLAKDLYMTSSINWIPKFVLIPRKGVKVSRNSDHQLMFVTSTDNVFVTVCSPFGEMIEMSESQFYTEYSLIP